MPSHFNLMPVDFKYFNFIIAFSTLRGFSYRPWSCWGCQFFSDMFLLCFSFWKCIFPQHGFVRPSPALKLKHQSLILNYASQHELVQGSHPPWFSFSQSFGILPVAYKAARATLIHCKLTRPPIAFNKGNQATSIPPGPPIAIRVALTSWCCH